MAELSSERCPYCRGQHPALCCPRIKRVEMFADGSVKHVEFHEHVLPKEKPLHESAPIIMDLLE